MPAPSAYFATASVAANYPISLQSDAQGPAPSPKKSAAVEKIVELRKRNYSIYEISQELKE